MNGFLQVLATLREQLNADLSRSDVLRALAWPIGILLSATVLLVMAKGPGWLLGILAGLLIAFVVLYGFTYIFCLFVDRDALRSERYKLQKMAIEQRLLGDSNVGLFEISSEVKTVEPVPTSPQIQGGDQ